MIFTKNNKHKNCPKHPKPSNFSHNQISNVPFIVPTKWWPPKQPNRNTDPRETRLTLRHQLCKKRFPRLLEPPHQKTNIRFETRNTSHRALRFKLRRTFDSNKKVYFQIPSRKPFHPTRSSELSFSRSREMRLERCPTGNLS